VFFRHDLYIYCIWCFSDMTSIFITSVFLRHAIYILTLVFIRHEIYIYNISVFLDIYDISGFFFRIEVYIYDISVFRHDIYIYNISVFLDMTSTFMTSVFFRHDIYIYDISVFHMIPNENHFIYRWMTKTKNSFNNRTVTCLQLS
jgi:hypothetical protein